MYDDTAPLGPDWHAEPWAARHHQLPPAAQPLPSPRHARHGDAAWPEPDMTDLDGAEPSAQVLQRLEATAAAAGALQSALSELELELLRLQSAVRRASPAMVQLMQAATEMRAAGIDEPRDRW